MEVVSTKPQLRSTPLGAERRFLHGDSVAATDERGQLPVRLDRHHPRAEVEEQRGHCALVGADVEHERTGRNEGPEEGPVLPAAGQSGVIEESMERLPRRAVDPEPFRDRDSVLPRRRTVQSARRLAPLYAEPLTNPSPLCPFGLFVRRFPCTRSR